MANNYYDATGVLILDQVTPVITALFGAFRLDATFPGDGEVYIARLSESDDPQWDDVLDGLVELAKAFGQPLPASDELGLPAVLRALAKHFRAEDREDLKQLIEHQSFEDEAELEDLFLIATCFDDGHGLTAIKLEGAWYCDKPRLFEFGGEGVFISREVTLYGASLLALELGHGLREALLQGDLDEAANWLTLHLNRLLSGIRDADTREALRLKLARKLI
jgi:hypothetical protein